MVGDRRGRKSATFSAKEERSDAELPRGFAATVRPRSVGRIAMSNRLGLEYWRERAEEARAQASEMRDPDARRTLLGIADNYEQLAQQAERIRKTRLAPIEL
jgi:hypothetical protein